jgi:hypothetical protein
LRAALVAAAVIVASQPASAQSVWEDRVFANISFGIDTGSTDISQNSSFVVYSETGTLQSNATFGSFGIFDFAIGARIYRNVGVAIAYHTGDTTGDGEISGSVPHPAVFDRPRTFSQEFNDADRDEHATHLQIGWMVPLNDKFDVFIYGGPSFYGVSQELVTNLTFAEQGPPFTSVTALAEIQQIKESAVGYNLGADATYFVYETDRLRLGVGGFLRFTGASADLEFTNNAGERQSIETDLGGVQFAFGARVRF